MFYSHKTMEDMSNTIEHKTYVDLSIIHMQFDHNWPTYNRDIHLQNVNG